MHWTTCRDNVSLRTILSNLYLTVQVLYSLQIGSCVENGLYDKPYLNNVKWKLDTQITQVTFLSIHPRVTSVWTGSVHVMTRFPVATVTTHFFTFQTIRVIAAFCKELGEYKQRKSSQLNKLKTLTIGILGHSYSARPILAICKIEQNCQLLRSICCHSSSYLTEG